MVTTETLTVQPGQTWADTRHPGRTIRISHITLGKAHCTELTNSTETQAYLDQVHGAPAPAGTYHGDKRGTTVKISIATLARKEWQMMQDATSQ